MVCYTPFPFIDSHLTALTPCCTVMAVSRLSRTNIYHIEDKWLQNEAEPWNKWFWKTECVYNKFQEPMNRNLQLPLLSVCHGIFTDWSIFSTPFLLWKKGSSGPVTQWRQLSSCDWLWHSHRSLIQSRFELKINRSMKMPWQKYSGVACSCS